MAQRSKKAIKALRLFDEFIAANIQSACDKDKLAQLRNHVEKWTAHKAVEIGTLSEDIRALRWSEDEEAAMMDFIANDLNLSPDKEVTDEDLESLLAAKNIPILDLSHLNCEDSMTMYLNELRSIRSLSVEEGKRLGGLVVEGKRASARLESEGPSLPPEEISALKNVIKKGGKAKNRLVEGSLQVAVNVAWRYEGQGVDIMDLIQEGSRSLITAADHYDPTRETPFSTYCAYWATKACRCAIIRQRGMISIPQGMYEDNGKIRRAIEQMAYEGHNNPTSEEIAARTKLSKQRVESVMNVRLQTKNISLDTTLNTPSSGEKEKSVADYTPDPSAEAMFRQMETVDMSSRLSSAMREWLTPIEAKILALRFGTEDGVERNLETIGEELGYSKERIRQVVVVAIEKLRPNKNVKSLHDAL